MGDAVSAGTPVGRSVNESSAAKSNPSLARLSAMEPTALTLSFVLSLLFGPACPATASPEPGFVDELEELIEDTFDEATGVRER